MNAMVRELGANVTYEYGDGTSWTATGGQTMNGSTLRLAGNYAEVVDEVLTLALCEREFEQGFLLYVMRPIPGRYEYFDCDDESYELSGRDQNVVTGGADSWSLEGGGLKIVLESAAASALRLTKASRSAC